MLESLLDEDMLESLLEVESLFHVDEGPLEDMLESLLDEDMLESLLDEDMFESLFQVALGSVLEPVLLAKDWLGSLKADAPEPEVPSDSLAWPVLR
jgi:hypothetical protein